MNINIFDPLNAKSLPFKKYFVDDEEVGLERLFISVFDGWLSEDDYVQKIEKASAEEIERINSHRLNFFKEFFSHCVIFDVKSNKFIEDLDIDSLMGKCSSSLNDSEDFLIFDYVNNLVVNTSFDYTDICYFTSYSNVDFVIKVASENQLFTFGE